jgi:type II secretory pathway pseudopilin PulG
VEILVVVLIMGIVLGMTGSLLGGFFDMFDASEDQNVARRRAQDVFNILSAPLQNAGIGVPSKDLGTFFDISGVTGFKPVNWTSPLSLGDSSAWGVASGDRMRVVYALPTGFKTGGNENADFSTKSSSWPEGVGGRTPAGNILFDRSISADLPSGTAPIDPYGIYAGGQSMLSYFTFPGMHMQPFYLNSASGTTFNATSSWPRFKISPDITGSNVVRAYHDLYSLHAALAYVDSAGYFYLMDVNGADPSMPPTPVYPPASDDHYSGLRIEGIAAIHFEQDPERRFVTVSVLAEGDTRNNTRDDNGVWKRLADRWLDIAGVNLVPGVYYEELSMTYRTRNLQFNN